MAVSKICQALRRWHIYIVWVICISYTGIVHGQDEESRISSLQQSIDMGDEVTFFNSLKAYYTFCAKANCSNMDLARFMELSMTFPHVRGKQFEDLVNAYHKLHANSPYAKAVDSLKTFKRQLALTEKSILTITNTPDLKTVQKLCETYQIIGKARAICNHRLQPFSIKKTDTLPLDDGFVYQLTFDGQEDAAPNIEVMENKGPGSIDIRYVNSRQAAIFQKRDTYTKIALSVPQSPWKTLYWEIHPHLIDAKAVDFNPQITRDHGLTVFNVNDDDLPVEIVFSDVRDASLKYPFVFDNLKNLQQTNFAKLVPSGDYKLVVKKMEDASLSSEFSVTLTKPVSSIPWVPLVVALTTFSLFYFFWTKLKSKNVSRIPNPGSKPELKNSMPPYTNPTKPLISVKTVAQTIKVEVQPAQKLDISLQEQNYIHLDLQNLWASTKVQKVYIKPEIILDIQRQISQPGNENIEIGGFLMGSAFDNVNKTYDISIDQYIDIEGEGQSEFQIGFGTDAWSKLEATMERGDKLLVGWFHTHPGHGVFLSRPDRNISSNFFNKPYHVAMEIDPLLRKENPRLDTAFFTQQLDGSLNNNGDVKGQWFSWTELLRLANDRLGLI